MRIAFVYDAIAPWATGGAERRVAALAERLSGRHEVHLVGWQWWDGPSTVERDGVILHGVGPAPDLYGADGKRTVREAVAFSARLLPFLLRNRFDVIDCSATPYLPLYSTALAARITGARLVATWHEFWGKHWSEYLPERPVVAHIARWLESGARRLGDCVVAVSPFTARAMDAEADPRLAIVPNGVDLASLLDAPAADEPIDVLFVGRLIDEKRVDLLIGSLQTLLARSLRPTCRIVGDGPERASLAEMASKAGVAEQVAFTGRVDDETLHGLLRAARILVLPSVREGFAMAVAEAQAAGAVPVVVRSPFSAAPDLVNDGVDGLVVEATADAIADAVESLLTDARLQVELSNSARVTGASRDWNAIAERIESIYLGEGTVAEPQPARSLRWS
jgi:glycosyltransferase involved in cell wall biosynthesis